MFRSYRSWGLMILFWFTLLASASLQPAIAQILQDGNKLVGAGAVGGASQGTVAVAADGNTAIVGGPSDNNGVGAVWVFTRSGGVWAQQGSKLVGSGAVGKSGQGRAVAISADGNTVMVGGSGDDGTMGAAWVFARSGGVWVQQGSKLVGSDAQNAYQGTSIALSADGGTAIVGGIGDNGFLGAAWIFTRTGGAWSQQGAKLVGMDVVGASRQGTSVALSSDREYGRCGRVPG